MFNWQTQLDTLRQDSRMPLLITAVITVLLLIAIGTSVSDFMDHHHKTIALKTKSIEPIIHIADLHLFGIYDASLNNLPNTQLQLTLEGTMVILGLPSQSRAIITSPGQPTQVYQVGDTLPGNATITRISKHYIVLNDNGTLEKLALPIQTISTDEGSSL